MNNVFEVNVVVSFTKESIIITRILIGISKLTGEYII